MYSFDFMYETILRKDPNYNGKFYTCVKTTKIFCIPACKAKTPLKENVEFVSNSKQALALDYRPCKRCYPLNYPHYCPEWVSIIEKYLKNTINRTVSDTELMKLIDVDISTIRRLFKKKNGISIKNFHRKVRLAKARELLHEGIPINKIAGMVGYRSTKGFKLAFTKHYGGLNFA